MVEIVVVLEVVVGVVAIVEAALDFSNVVVLALLEVVVLIEIVEVVTLAHRVSAVFWET